MTDYKKIKFKAFGKINLILDVVGKRDDGYHLLNTVMQSVSCCDIIEIEIVDGEGIEIICDKDGFPCNESNLIWKACEAFSKYTETDFGGRLKITVEKNLPSMAGMGGGSADCASVLCALNIMFKTLLDNDQLCKIGLQLGADVPFCVNGGTRLCQGIGEITNRLPSPDCFFVIIKPDVSVSTPVAFKKYDTIANPEKAKLEFFLKGLTSGNIFSIAGYMFNVLEYASGLAEIEKAKHKLINAGALNSIMTGSGSAVFGIFDNEQAANKAKEKLSEYSYCEVCRPVKTGFELIEII